MDEKLLLEAIEKIDCKTMTPVIIWDPTEKYIVLGNNRLNACMKLGITPDIEDVDGNKYEIVKSKGKLKIMPMVLNPYEN